MATDMIAICTLVRNEHEYLKEWIEYHLALGIDAIHIYEDYGSLSHADICSAYPKVHLMRFSDIFPVRMKEFRQLVIFRWFLNNHKEYDWCAFIDVDEFIDTPTPLTDILSNANCAGILMPWVIYNANGRIHKSPTILDSYTQISPLPMKTGGSIGGWDFKSFVNMKVAEDFTNIHLISGETEQTEIKLRHYYTKSWEDWVDRLKRGNLSRNLRQIEDFFYFNPEMESKELVESVDWHSPDFCHTEIISIKYRIYNYPSNKGIIEKYEKSQRNKLISPSGID